MSPLIRTLRVTDLTTRAQALAVLGSTYRDEKRWVEEAESQLPPGDLDRATLSWFLTLRGETPAGVLRVHYDPPLAQYRDYDVRPLDRTIDVEGFLCAHRIAEIGRFAIVPAFRRDFSVALALMRAATRETIERGFTHYITDVFENERHSPYGFHTRVMGFAPVATHERGELRCLNRRITMILDIKAAYQRLRREKRWIFRSLTADWDEGLHRRLAV